MKYFGFLLLVVCQFSLAVDCYYEGVESVQAQKHNVLVRAYSSQGAAWKTIGSHTDPWIKSFQSVAQQAMAARHSIALRFPDGHNCLADDYSTVPDMVRITK